MLDNSLLMDIQRQIPPKMSQILVKMFNLMIQTRMFPTVLKVARVLPLTKPNQCKLDPFRPISILNQLEKQLEEELKEQITNYFEDKGIIPDQHHGGRNGHSTMMDKAIIDKLTADKLENCERKEFGMIFRHQTTA